MITYKLIPDSSLALTLFSDIIKNMLEKNENFFCDSHLHFTLIPQIQEELENTSFLWAGCSCCHSVKEWENQIDLKLSKNIFLLNSFGLHPQNLKKEEVTKLADYLQNLCSSSNKLNAIGEAGFDYYSNEYKNHCDLQEEMFNIQLDLALMHQLPLIIHCRKANHKLFEYCGKLKKLPSVLFHSFMGPKEEALSLLSKGINGFFSFGQQMMNNNKKVIDCVINLPEENLLLETDAPFQTLKDQSFTCLGDIKNIYSAAFYLRNQGSAQEDFKLKMQENFKKMFLII